jgi:hypothetical protein
MHSLEKTLKNIFDEKFNFFGKNMDNILHNHSNDILTSHDQLGNSIQSNYSFLQNFTLVLFDNHNKLPNIFDNSTTDLKSIQDLINYSGNQILINIKGILGQMEIDFDHNRSEVDRKFESLNCVLVSIKGKSDKNWKLLHTVEEVKQQHDAVFMKLDVVDDDIKL